MSPPLAGLWQQWQWRPHGDSDKQLRWPLEWRERLKSPGSAPLDEMNAWRWNSLLVQDPPLSFQEQKNCRVTFQHILAMSQLEVQNVSWFTERIIGTWRKTLHQLPYNSFKITSKIPIQRPQFQVLFMSYHSLMRTHLQCKLRLWNYHDPRSNWRQFNTSLQLCRCGNKTIEKLITWRKGHTLHVTVWRNLLGGKFLEQQAMTLFCCKSLKLKKKSSRSQEKVWSHMPTFFQRWTHPGRTGCALLLQAKHTDQMRNPIFLQKNPQKNKKTQNKTQHFFWKHTKQAKSSWDTSIRKKGSLSGGRETWSQMFVRAGHFCGNTIRLASWQRRSQLHYGPNPGPSKWTLYWTQYHLKTVCDNSEAAGQSLLLP